MLLSPFSPAERNGEEEGDGEGGEDMLDDTTAIDVVKDGVIETDELTSCEDIIDTSILVVVGNTRAAEEVVSAMSLETNMSIDSKEGEGEGEEENDGGGGELRGGGGGRVGSIMMDDKKDCITDDDVVSMEDSSVEESTSVVVAVVVVAVVVVAVVVVVVDGSVVDITTGIVDISIISENMSSVKNTSFVDDNMSGGENMLTVASVSEERMVVDDFDNEGERDVTDTTCEADGEKKEVVAIGTETLVAVDDGEGIAALELDGAKEDTEAAVVGSDVEETIVYKINNKNRHTIII